LKKKKSKLEERERTKERRKNLGNEGIEKRRDERKQKENKRMTRKE
jgi:hypothetical protein